MKQVILRITHYHLSGKTSHYYHHSYPISEDEVEAYIAEHEPSNPYHIITDVKVIDIEEARP